MKNKFMKILSSILVLALLLSTFSVLVFASDSSDSESASGANDAEDLKLILYRTFEDGWDHTNGMVEASGKENHFMIENEETDTFGYNYFLRNDAQNSQDCFVQIQYGTNEPTFGGAIFELDLKIDDATDLGDRGNILGFRTPGGSSGGISKSIVKIKENTLYLPGAGDFTAADANQMCSHVASPLGNKWVRIAFAFDVDWRKCPTCDAICNSAGVNDTTAVICSSCAEIEAGGGAAAPTLGEMEGYMRLVVYYGYADTFNASQAVLATSGTANKDLSKTYYYTTGFEMTNGQKPSLDLFRITLPGSPNQVGQSYCVDNITIYNGPKTPVPRSVIDALGDYGVNVNPEKEKTIEILDGKTSLSNIQFVETGIAMKVGVDYALDRNVRTPIYTTAGGKAYGAPAKIDGQVYVPLQALVDHFGFPIIEHTDGISFDIATDTGTTALAINRNTATVNGELLPLTKAPTYVTDTDTSQQYIVIALEDINALFKGYYVTYDEMGLILVTTKENVLKRSTGLNDMMTIMKRFVFDSFDVDSIYATVKTKSHPYILADQNQFDYLNRAYTSGSNADLKGYLDQIVAQAEGYYTTYANVNGGSYSGLKSGKIVNPHADGNNYGYNIITGMLDEIVTFANELRVIALAYQITRNNKYLALAYDFAVELGNWDHWGPGYFINCAEATAAYAMAYDWLYTAWKTAGGYNLTTIENILYTNGITEGELASKNACNHPSSQAHSVYYTSMDSHWNTVGSSSMIIASLALLGSADLATNEGRFDASVHTPAVASAKFLISNNLTALIENGLAKYAPDGSHIESPTIWAKSTNALYSLIWALDGATGDTLGLVNTWGLDTTFYYAAHIEYSALFGEYQGELKDSETGYMLWNYHESEQGALDTSMLFYAAQANGDNNLAAIRLNQIDAKGAGIFDVLAYNDEIALIDPSDVKLDLDYLLSGISGAVSRDSWEDGCLYTGLMGNPNGTQNGQIDSGNFIYANKGFTWFHDAGAENSGVYGLLDEAHRYTYYRNNAEGANVVCLTTPGSDYSYGQDPLGGGVITKHEANEFGSITILDNSAAYGSRVNYARRGLLFTNDRQTVVIQDEMAFADIQSVIWIGQTVAEDVSISADGRTAYLVQTIGDRTYMLRATLVSKTASLVFEKVTASDDLDFILSATKRKSSSVSMGGENEYSRSSYSRLVIDTGTCLTFDCAVVLEMVASKADEAPVQYDYVNMSEWEIAETYTTTVDDGIRNSLITDISDYSAEATRIMKKDTHYGEDLQEYYTCLISVAKALEIFRPEIFANIPEIKGAYDDYLVYAKEYAVFCAAINALVDEDLYLGVFLGGYNW